jgi:hypothetical protein
MYVVVTVFDPADGKGRVTHAWGTYASMAAAANAVKRMKRQDTTDRSRPGALTYHTCEVLGEESR